MSNIPVTSPTHSAMVLTLLYELGGGSIKHVPFEDLVVGLYKRYPKEFHLKGHPEYPDSGASIHKRLYELKKHGYVDAHRMVFALTTRGIDYARKLSNPLGARSDKSFGKLSRSARAELERIRGLEGFELFVHGKGDMLSDGDFYKYLGVTVRTSKNAFRGRLETIEETISELRASGGDKGDVIAYHDFLMERNKRLIEYFTHA